MKITKSQLIKIIKEEIENYKKSVPPPIPKQSPNDDQKKSLIKNIKKQLLMMAYLKEAIRTTNFDNINKNTKETFKNLLYFIEKQNTLAFYEQILGISDIDLKKLSQIFKVIQNHEKFNTYTTQTVMEIAKKVINRVINIGQQKIEQLSGSLEEIYLTEEQIEQFVNKECEMLEEDNPLHLFSKDFKEKHNEKLAKKKKLKVPPPILDPKEVEKLKGSK